MLHYKRVCVLMWDSLQNKFCVMSYLKLKWSPSFNNHLKNTMQIIAFLVSGKAFFTSKLLLCLPGKERNYIMKSQDTTRPIHHLLRHSFWWGLHLRNWQIDCARSELVQGAWGFLQLGCGWYQSEFLSRNAHNHLEVFLV